MISTSNFKNGFNILVDEEPYQILWFQNHKPGKGGSVMRVKLKHLKKGCVIERTFKSGEKFYVVDVVRQKKRFLYKEGESFNFMDINTYEQVLIHSEFIGKMSCFLKENLEIEAIYLENELIGIDFPIIIEMLIIESDPGIKGNSVLNMTKMAKLETGISVRVPMFIKKGDKIKLNTKTGEYIERV
jgi:elongation factor P